MQVGRARWASWHGGRSSVWHGSWGWQLGQQRWGLVGWVDWQGQTGTQVVHLQLLAPADWDNSWVIGQSYQQFRLLPVSVRFFCIISNTYAGRARDPLVGQREIPRCVNKYGFGR